MSTAAPWSVKGIDPRARDAAKDLARREGLTLGEWLNRMILEEEQESPPPPFASSRLGAYAPPSYDDRDAPDEIGRITQALDRISRRLDASEQRTTLALTGVDHTVLGIAARVDQSEKAAAGALSRVETGLQDLQALQTGLAERLRRMEEDDAPARTIGALRALESALSRLAAHVQQGEDKAATALGALQSQIAGLNDRLAAGLSEARRTSEEQAQKVKAAAPREVENRVERLESEHARAVAALAEAVSKLRERIDRADAVDPGPTTSRLKDLLEQRFQLLAGEVSRAMADLRREIPALAPAAAAPEPDLSPIERGLAELHHTLAAAERRHMDAMEALRTEVADANAALDRRLSLIERAPPPAPDEGLRADMDAIAARIEQRLHAIEARETAALTVVSDQVAKLSDRFDSRLADSEQRTAAALERIGNQFADVAERLAAVPAPILPAAVSPATPVAPAGFAEPTPDWSAPSPARSGPEARKDHAPFDPFLSDERSAAPSADSHLDDTTVAFDDDGLDGESGFSVAQAPHDRDNWVDALEPLEGFAAQDGARPDKAQENYLARARRAAIDSQTRQDRARRNHKPFAKPAQTATFFAEGDDEVFLGAPRKSKTRLSPLTLALAGGAALAALAVVALLATNRPAAAPAGPPPAALPPAALAPAPAPAAITVAPAAEEASATEPAAGEAAPRPFEQAGAAAAPAARTPAPAPPPARPSAREERAAAPVRPAPARPAAQRTAPQRTAAPAAAPARPAPPRAAAPAAEPGPAAPAPEPRTLAQAAAAGDPVAQFELGQQRMQAGAQEEGAELIRRAADQGLAMAQYRLAKMHERGEGVPRDLAEARRWTQRAADAGNRQAIHNLAVFAAQGEGTPQDLALAADLFARAARLGLVDSQFNLAALNEDGVGVPANLPEAVFWYGVAARNGDRDSQAKLAALEPKLSASEREAIRRRVQAFRPEQGNPRANGSFGKPSWSAG
jgi:localization factor PodJL